MKYLPIAFLLASSVCFATTPIDVATKHLIQADKLFQDGKMIDAAREDLEVLKVKGLPDEVYSSAFLLMGNIGVTTNQLGVADIAYKRVLKLKHAPALDKKAAKSGITLVGDIKKDAEERESAPEVYR